MCGSPGDGTIRRMQAPTGAIPTTIATTMAGISMKATGTTKITVTITTITTATGR
jgi:hypothetical protein